jgi:hypothetical protein
MSQQAEIKRLPKIESDSESDTDEEQNSIRKSGEFARHRRKISLFRSTAGDPMYHKVPNPNGKDHANEGFIDTDVETKSNPTIIVPTDSKQKSGFFTNPFQSKTNLNNTKKNQNQLKIFTKDKTSDNEQNNLIEVGEIDDFINTKQSLKIDTKVNKDSSPITTSTDLVDPSKTKGLIKRGKQRVIVPIQLSENNDNLKGPNFWLEDQNHNNQNDHRSLVKLEETNSKSRRRSSSISISSANTDDDLFQQELLDNIEKHQFELIQAMTDKNKRDVILNYYNLIMLLGMKRSFFNPELDILNRFCLEYTSIAIKTDNPGIFFRQLPSYERVFIHMTKRTESVSTPVSSGPVGPEVPVLLTRVFLNEFRIHNSGVSDIGMFTPIFAHQHRISKDRFKAICENVFSKKDRYFKATVDVSRHTLAHLN